MHLCTVHDRSLHQYNPDDWKLNSIVLSLQVLLALPSSHNVFSMQQLSLPESEPSSEPSIEASPRPLSLREAVQLPVSLFRLWICAQTSLVLPISTLSTEAIIHVNAGLIEACGQLKELVIVRGHESDAHITPKGAPADCADLNSNSNANACKSSVTQQRDHEDSGRGLWMLQLALERVGSMQRLELHGQVISPSEVCLSFITVFLDQEFGSST